MLRANTVGHAADLLVQSATVAYGDALSLCYSETQVPKSSVTLVILDWMVAPAAKPERRLLMSIESTGLVTLLSRRAIGFPIHSLTLYNNQPLR